MRTTISLLALAGLATAHFQLKYPPTLGFDDDKEPTAPCGGFTPNLDSDKLADFHIDGDAVAVRLSHPQSKWLFRVTADPSDDKSWEQIYPIVQQSGLGDFCLPQLTVPEKYAGKKGVISIVSSAVDGLLYQCASVNFVTGTQKAPSECKNATITVSFTDDSSLSDMASGNGGLGGSSASNSTATKTSGGASSTSAGSGSTTSAKPSSSPNAAAANAGSALLALGAVLLL